MSPKELAQYARVMRRMGVVSLKVGEAHITLDLSHTPAPKPTKQSQPESSTPESDNVDEDAVLFWSAGA